MELLDVTLTPAQRRKRTVYVERQKPSGRAAPRPGEKLLLRDEERDYYTGTVVDAIDLDDAWGYVLRVGVRLPEEVALLRLGRRRPPAHRDETAARPAPAVERDTLVTEVPVQRLSTDS